MPAYKLLVEFYSYDELKAYLDKSPAAQGVAVVNTPAVEVAGQNVVAAASPEPEDDTPPFLREKKKPGRKPKAEVAAEPQTKTKTPEEKPSAQPAKAAEPEIPYKTVQEATMNFHKTFGRQKTLDLLGEFGVKIATDLKVGQYADYLKRIEELSAEGELA